VFVSRFDRLVDADFMTKGLEASKLGIVNATKCYHEINKFKNPNIRTLFASTGVKGDELSPSYYVDNLIYPNSVNTAPLATIEDWFKDGSKVPTPIMSESDCNRYFETLKSKNICMETIYSKLLKDGIEAFKVSFKDLLSKLIH
jgi:transaldolase